METLEMALLLDYYGAMLTEKQREYLDMRFNQDMSLSEIAQVQNVSRQAVFDNLSRTEAQLRRMEEKIGSIRRDRAISQVSRTILEAAGVLVQYPDREVAALAQSIITAAEGLE